MRAMYVRGGERRRRRPTRACGGLRRRTPCDVRRASLGAPVGCSDAAPWPVCRIASVTVARRASVKRIRGGAVPAADGREQRPVAGERATAVLDAQVAEQRRRRSARERARPAREQQQAARARKPRSPRREPCQ